MITNETYSFAKRIFCAAVAFNLAFAIFAETEEELQKRILSNANLAGESAEELMSADNENDTKLGGKKQKVLASTFDREVPYLQATLDLMEGYYNHACSDLVKRAKLHREAVSAANEVSDEYSRLVHLARAEYFYGMAMIENFDYSSYEGMDLTKSEANANANARACQTFDKSIEYAQNALKIKKGTDAYTILAHSISANCTTQGVLYILSNGLKVRSYAKKAVELDYSNGTAHFLTLAQDAYAPWPFAKLRSSRRKLESLLKDKYIRIDNQDRILICSAIGNTYFRQKKWNQATEWFNKALEVYPLNLPANQMLGTINRRKEGGK